MLMGCSIQKATVQYSVLTVWIIQKSHDISINILKLACFHWIKISLIEKL